MLTTLAIVKARLALLETEAQFDALLTRQIGIVSALFERECGRLLERRVGYEQAFPAQELGAALELYPLEGTITKFELKWGEGSQEKREVLDVAHLVTGKRSSVWLQAPLGVVGQLGVLTYTGGYVGSGVTPQAGQTALPTELEGAATEQVAFWFRQKDRIGLESWGAADFVSGKLEVGSGLLAQVVSVLKKYRRVVL